MDSRKERQIGEFETAVKDEFSKRGHISYFSYFDMFCNSPVTKKEADNILENLGLEFDSDKMQVVKKPPEIDINEGQIVEKSRIKVNFCKPKRIKYQGYKYPEKRSKPDSDGNYYRGECGDHPADADW